MNQNYIVFKFVLELAEDTGSIPSLQEAIRQFDQQKVVLVVSASDWTINSLEELLGFYLNNEQDHAFRKLEEIRQVHLQAINDFTIGKEEALEAINEGFVEIEWIIEDEPQDGSAYLYDQIISIGSIVASKIVSCWLRNLGTKTNWVDARDLLLTDNQFQAATIHWQETEERFNNHALAFEENRAIPIFPGGIGSTSENFTTTLGVDGRNYAAAIFANLLKAKRLILFSPTGNQELSKDTLSFLKDKGIAHTSSSLFGLGA